MVSDIIRLSTRGQPKATRRTGEQWSLVETCANATCTHQNRRLRCAFNTETTPHSTPPRTEDAPAEREGSFGALDNHTSCRAVAVVVMIEHRRRLRRTNRRTVDNSRHRGRDGSVSAPHRLSRVGRYAVRNSAPTWNADEIRFRTRCRYVDRMRNLGGNGLVRAVLIIVIVITPTT